MPSSSSIVTWCSADCDWLQLNSDERPATARYTRQKTMDTAKLYVSAGDAGGVVVSAGGGGDGCSVY